MSEYLVSFACISDKGRVRSVNQDNYICNGAYMGLSGATPIFPLKGTVNTEGTRLFGVFDGMGGEDKGEVAAFIAAQEAAGFDLTGNVNNRIRQLCHAANARICRYTLEHDDVFAMGATAAMAAFTPGKIVLCNIGDSKIFRISDGVMKQVSEDHLMFAPRGVKPPLSQNLGIPESEMIIDPYIGECFYKDGDIFLICSDGLTDMAAPSEIQEMITAAPGLAEAVTELVNTAMDRGGKDNVTVILLKIIEI